MENTSQSANFIRSVAIIGSGISGLTAAIRLRESGIETVVFEKSRGPGGRLATKRTGNGAVDIGAQYFTIRSPKFRAFLDRYAGKTHYAEWHGELLYQQPDKSWAAFRPSTRYVGVPRMTAISRALSVELALRFETRIGRIERNAQQQWVIIDTAGETQGRFDAVVVTAPPVQARDLLADSGLDIPQHDPVFHDFPLQACWAVAARFARPVPFDGNGFSADHPILQWAANNSSKPDRTASEHWWVLHARAGWSEMQQAASAEWIQEQMLNAFGEIIGQRVHPEETRVHRWLYAKTIAGKPGPGHRWYPSLRIGLCGDWLQGGRVEGAFESAESLMAELRATGALG